MTRIILTIALLPFFSCNRPQVKPEVYNDSLVVHQIRVVEKADKLQDAFASFGQDEMNIRHKDLENQIKTSINIVEKTAAFDGDETYKKAVLEMLNGYNKLLNKEYKEAEKILEEPDSLYSDRDEARIEMLYKQIDKLSEKLNKDFEMAQEIFLKKHLITVKSDSNKTK